MKQVNKIIKISRIFATVFGAGYLPLAPGTWGSLAALPFCIILHPYMYLNFTVFLVLFIAGVFASDIVEKDSGEKDPGYIVIDEFACLFLVFVFIPLSIKSIIIGFLIYRAIDIVKLPPMKALENVPKGWGVMLDDLMSGIYTNLILQILLFYKII